MSASTAGAGGAAVASTGGTWMNGMALVVAATTLVAATMAMYKLARWTRRH
ncbi:hypothetical protein [Streptomyces sp. NPDC091209]|uniref:hypothetical protein n=1 Tax=Streptomyces sp. NPDC091209 TaxID=3365974 RepID=UPI0037FE1D28